MSPETLARWTDRPDITKLVSVNQTNKYECKNKTCFLNIYSYMRGHTQQHGAKSRQPGTRGRPGHVGRVGNRRHSGTLPSPLHPRGLWHALRQDDRWGQWFGSLDTLCKNGNCTWNTVCLAHMLHVMLYKFFLHGLYLNGVLTLEPVCFLIG